MDDVVNSINEGIMQHRAALAAQHELDRSREAIARALRQFKSDSAYSHARLFLASGNMRLRDAPIEFAVSEALAREYGVQPRLVNSAFIDAWLTRTITTSTSSAGYAVNPAAELAVGVPGRANGFLDLCTVITPGVPTGHQQVGRFDALPAVTVLANETATITEGAPGTSRTLLTPSNCGTYIPASRSWVLQTRGGAEALARLKRNALRNHAQVQILEGTGADGQVLGLGNDSAIANASGTTLAWSTVAATQEVVESAAGDGPLAWVVTAPAATLIRQRATISGGEAILANGRMGGYPAIVVGGTSSAMAVFGRWSDLLVYEWAPIEIAVNPFQNFAAGLIGVRGWASFNAAPMVNQSFATITGIT